MVNIRCVPAFADNYIWLVGAAGRNSVAVVDPGDPVPVLTALERDGLTLAAILVTHHHRDHTGGVVQLAERYRVPVYGPATESIPALTVPVQEGIEVEAAGVRFQVLDTPGHTRGHVCYVTEQALFCGDTLFTAGCGRLFEGTPAQMYASLAKLAALPDRTLVYCAHEYTADNLMFAAVAEPANAAVANRRDSVATARAAGRPTVPATLAEEKATNPFLRCTDPTLVTNASAFAGRPLEPGAETFAVVRHWKDTLD